MCLPQVNSLEIIVTVLAKVKPIEAALIAKIGQGMLIICITIGTLEALKEPLRVAAAAHQPPFPFVLVKEGYVGSAATGRAIPPPPDVHAQRVGKCLSIG